MANNNSFTIKLQAVLDKIKSLTNIKADIKAIEPKLPKIKIKGTLDKAATNKELKAKIKDVKPKVKVDADTSPAEKKIKKIGKQKNKTTITPTVDNTQVVSGLKKTQKEVKSAWNKFSDAVFNNLMRMAVQSVTQAIREAISAVKELDTIKTNIQMVSGTSDSGVNAMMSSYNAMARDLSSTTKDVAEAANEFLRMGESIENTNELIKSSQILSKVGMINSADAASYLISSLKGYQVAAENSIDIVSKLTSVDLEAAVSAGGLAEAISRCSNIANNSGTSMDRLIGYTAAVGEVTQESMSVIGNAFKSIYSRMNNIKIGKFIDDETGESLSDTEAVLNKLGIQLRDTTDTYRNFDDVLDDIGGRWSNLTQVEQNALSVAMAGTMQRERFTVLMNNYSSALEYSAVAANSAGNALERYGVYQDSIEAKTNELTAAVESLSTNTISEELYSGIIVATTNLVEFIDKTNLLKGTLAGLIAMGASKAIVSLGAGFITAAKSTAQLTAAMKLFDNEKSVGNLRDIGAACKGLSEKQLKLVLSTKGLEHEDRKLILVGMGVEEQEQEQMLATLGFAAAEDKATASTFSLKGAMNTLKTAFALNPIGFIITGITAVVSVATMAISNHNQKLEEMHERAKEAADSANTLGDEIAELASKYISLSEAVKTDESAKEDLMSTQTELLKKLGLEGEGIDDLIAKYGSLSKAIKQASIDSLKEAQIDLIAGVDAAREDLLRASKDNFWGSKNIISATGEDAVKAFEELEKAGIVGRGAYGSGGGALVLTGDNTVDGALENFKRLEDAVNALRDSEAFTASELSKNSLFQAIYGRYSELKNGVEGYKSAIGDLNENLSQQTMLTALQGQEIPKTEEAFNTFKQELIDTAIASKQFIGNEKEIASAINSYLSTVPDFEGYYSIPLENELGIVQDLVSDLGRAASFSTFTDTAFGTRIQHITDMFNDGTISHKEYFEALQSEIDNFDASNFTDSIEDMDKASAQFFVDSMQQAASGLSGLINSFDNGEMSISEYLEGYLAIGNTLSTLTDNLQENSAAWNKHSEAISEVGNTALDDTQNKINSAMSIIESYQDSIYSLEQIMNDTVTVGSDEFTAHANVIAEDLYNIVQTGGEMADTIASTLGTTTSEIAQSLTENVSNQEIACQAIMANTNNAITSMADSIGELFDTLGDAISNFKVDLSFGVKSIDWKKVNVLGAELSLPEIKFELGASGESLDKIGSALSSFGKTIASNYTPQTIELEDFHFGSTDAAKDRKYSPGSDITNNYENALDRIKGATSAAKSEFEEMVDFFERRVEVLDDALSHLDSTLDNVAGSFGKNNLIDAELGINEEKFNNYTDALSMYTQKANEAFAKLPSDIASRVKDGAVALTDFVGDGNKDVVEAIKEYESWADKISDCQQELAELKKEIRQLELEKFNNIMDDFSSQFSLRGNSKDLISKQIDLLKEAGELIGKSFYTAQIEQTKKQLELLENEKAQLVKQMSSAISSGRVQKGTEEWLEMVNALNEVDGSILDCKKSIEEFDNAILDLRTEIFDRIQKQFSNLDSELSNILDLFDGFEVSDDKGAWSKEGLAQLGLLAQQYELAQYRVQQYNDEIDELNAQYLAGKYSATEYGDKLAELSSGQWDAVQASESAKDAIMDLNEARVDNAVKGIEKEIDAYKELIDAQLDALKASKDLHDYEKSIAEKTKSVTDLERQIAAMQNDTSAAAVAKRKTLEDQLADARKDLEEAEYEHSVEAQEDALNKQYEAYEKSRNEEIDKLRESLTDRETILAESFNTVKNNASTVGQEIATVATEHGIKISDSLVSSWKSGENAIAGYGEVLTPKTSAFVGNVGDIETGVYSLQEQADATAGSLSETFSVKADVLVTELITSYDAASNLALMTDALHNSLIDTLGSGYDVSSLVNSINDIADAANKAKMAIDSLGNLPKTNVSQSNVQYGITDGINTLYSSNNIADINKWLDENKNIYSLGNVTTSTSGSKTFKVSKYASGTRNANDGLRVVNEEGPELVLPKLSSGNYTVGNAGDQILTKAETDNVFEWAEVNPEDFIPVSQEELVESLRKRGNRRSVAEPMDFTALTTPSANAHVMQEMFKNAGTPGSVVDRSVNNNSVNVHYDSMFKIEGDVIDADRITKQMEKAAIKIADQRIDKSWREFSDGLRYGGCAASMHAHK